MEQLVGLVPQADIRTDWAIAPMADFRCGPELPVRLDDPNQCTLAAFVHKWAPKGWATEGGSRDKFSKTRWTCPGPRRDRDPRDRDLVTCRRGHGQF